LQPRNSERQPARFASITDSLQQQQH